MIRTLSSAQALAELPPRRESRTVASWLNGRDDRFLGIGADRRAAQIRPEPFTLGPVTLTESTVGRLITPVGQSSTART